MAINATAQQFIDAMTAKNITAISSLLADNFQATGGAQAMNKQTYIALLNAYFTGFSDWSFNFNNIMEVAGKVNYSTRLTGTHNGTFNLNPVGIAKSVPPTRKKVSLPPSSSVLTPQGGVIVSLNLGSVEANAVQTILKQIGA
jgi:predicted ester cyclase